MIWNWFLNSDETTKTNKQKTKTKAKKKKKKKRRKKVEKKKEGEKHTQPTPPPPPAPATHGHKTTTTTAKVCAYKPIPLLFSQGNRNCHVRISPVCSRTGERRLEVFSFPRYPVCTTTLCIQLFILARSTWGPRPDSDADEVYLFNLYVLLLAFIRLSVQTKILVSCA